ncbi:MAG TPA: tyrosine-protein phosphatase [Candidatus Wunengus sp. YC63]|uniref:tyrosine-protein phosphatase n=1 Tax=Candidatus Wunengus sp. YC63 TaxID=3367699 RepID=UPI004028BF39
MIDIHTHILPAIDDGPTTMTESLEMCRIAVNDGIKKMIATPHVQNGMYDLDANKVLEKIQMLNQLLKQEGLDLVIFPGAEVHLNDRLLDAKILKESSILTLNGGRKYILLEFPFQWVPSGTEHVIFKLRSMGFTPILPHLERNFKIQRDPYMVRHFAEMGAILQVTAQSITGDFDAAPMKCALWMLKNNLVHVIASDAHSPVGRPPILSKALKVVSDKLGEEAAKKMVLEHPRMILEGLPFST